MDDSYEGCLSGSGKNESYIEGDKSHPFGQGIIKNSVFEVLNHVDIDNLLLYIVRKDRRTNRYRRSSLGGNRKSEFVLQVFMMISEPINPIKHFASRFLNLKCFSLS